MLFAARVSQPRDHGRRTAAQPEAAARSPVAGAGARAEAAALRGWPGARRPLRARVELLAGVTGRVVVTGMGKSGHVARKIAATLASTGTPALFVHPAEASHGDLGMITPGDAVLALSNSGETAELRDLIAYYAAVLDSADRDRRPGATATLADAADVVLLLPEVAEACPMGLAPTTSTT